MRAKVHKVSIGIALALGAVIGVLLGLLGGGGSILAVPALVYVLGLGVEQAIPMSLIVIGVASAVGALPKVRANQVQWRLAGIFAAAGIPATFIGTAIGKHLPQPVLLIGFASVMVVAEFGCCGKRGTPEPPAVWVTPVSTGVVAPRGRSPPDSSWVC